MDSLESAGRLSGTATPREHQSALLRAPPEIVHRILSNCSTLQCISSTAQTCQDLRAFIYQNENQALWRDLLLDRYDDPRLGSQGKEKGRIQWKKKVQDRTLVERMLTEWPDEKTDEMVNQVELICETLHDLYLDIPVLAHGQISKEEPTNSVLLSFYLTTPAFQTIYYKIVTQKDPTQLRIIPGNASSLRNPENKAIPPLLCKLHLLNPSQSRSVTEQSKLLRGEQRRITYSMANFPAESGYGPFDRQGKVDWRMVDAVGSVMMANARDALMDPEAGWQAAAKPLIGGIDAVRGLGVAHLERPDDLEPGEIWDWAGVNGLWRGSYAFLDYTDWIALNRPGVATHLRRRQFVDLVSYTEAVGDLMKIKFQVCDNSPQTLIGSLPQITSTCPTSSALPILYFHGVPRSRAEIQAEFQEDLGLPDGDSNLAELVEEAAQTPTSFIRGCVRLTTDSPPQVRWTFVVRYGGADRWQLEGVQVGGVGSRRGIFGNWTDVEKSVDSPCGPIWYWKI